MSAFNALAHNGSLMLRAESIINSFLNSETEEHKVACYLVNPDGTRVAIQKGFKLENYEYTILTRGREYGRSVKFVSGRTETYNDTKPKKKEKKKTCRPNPVIR